MGADEEERYVKTLIAAVQDLATQLGQVREQVKEDTARLLANYREDTNRSVTSIYVRILSYEDELIRDRTIRERRQREIDVQLSAIRNSQRRRVYIEVGILVTGLVALAYLVGQWL